MSELLQLILDSTARIFEDQCTREVRERADAGEWPSKLWQEVTAAGLTSALLPEEAGGAGLSFADALAVIRLSGYHAVPVPLGETMIAAKIMFDANFEYAGGPLTLAASEGGGHLEARPTADGASELVGACDRVPWAREASGILAEVTTEAGVRLTCVPPDEADVSRGANLANEPRDLVRMNGAACGDSAFASWERGRLLLLGALIRAQQLAGAAQRALDLSTRYAGERVQFGRPIAKFQAIQQQLAAMAGHVAAANAGADAAAAGWGTDKAEFLVAVAKSRAAESAGHVAAIAHQVHGAMGFTREHPLHYVTRRLWSWRDEFGSETFWQNWLGEHVLAMGADELWPYLVRSPSPV